MENSRIFKTMRSRDGFIGGGAHPCWPWSTGGVHTPVGLGQQGSKKIKFRSMAQFPRFFLF